MTVNGVYAMSVITALTAQNTLGVKSVFEVTLKFLREQIDAVFSDIFPDAVKIGMIASGELACIIADKLSEYGAKNIVIDPVMVSTSGSSLMRSDAVKVVSEKLFPLATVITPNIPEAEVLADMKICNSYHMEKAAKFLGDKFSCAVLIKGGHSINDANDLLYHNGESKWFMATRVDNTNTHGTGCTLSSAICSYLAKGMSLADSVTKAKEYIHRALLYNLNLGHGQGPLNHMVFLDNI